MASMEREPAQIRRDLAMVHAYQAGADARAVGIQFGVRRQTVLDALHRAGVKMRTRGKRTRPLDPRPRCQRCGIILEECGLRDHPAQWSGDTCWLCEAELAEARR